ncbi:hypothetical protein K504DRAFT_131843 [Pleomassaria siparia CBS 279.74]|uniref:Uncharacterized protein n=1 Tax=Pleomassaria siparia CBS 279.74 TaxID=1314801 RepID=A0A6G1KJR5_9PLEO|nr:hypothetical protein K504DRAFT_131843 [Pleomassaria siparia CBS 279.74]
MSTTMAANGVVPSEARREADFIERLLHIRDQVFASKHPRIQLPSKVLEQVAPRPAHYTPPSSRPTTNGTPNGAHSLSSKPFPPRPESFAQYPPSAHEFVSPARPTQRPFSAVSTSSGIDPVLLTKSDHLIRAELQLKRQQIERDLKDQLDKKSRGNDTEDRESRFDVEGVLTKAHELVKPLSGLQVSSTNSDRTESFDENSYYSSKANSWSPEEGDTNKDVNGVKAAEPLNLQAKRSAIEAQLTTAKPATPTQPKLKQVEPTVIDLDEEAYEPVDDIEIYEPEPAQIQDEAEESDYSPPPATLTPNGPSRGRGRERGPVKNGGTNGSSRQQSPVGIPAPIQNTRKRRRDEKRDEKRRQQANKRVVRSPEPYIKEEPQSPPSFAVYPDSQPSKRRALQALPSDIETPSAREGRTQPVYYREQESASHPLRQYEEPSSPTVIRVPVPQRRAERDDQDLRRVASLQYTRRPYSPLGGQAYPPPEIRQARASSHAFVDRPIEQPVYREASVRPSAAPRYVRERSRSPVQEFLSRPQSPVTMAPPRRIVLDQYGNKYYAALADVRESMAPPGRRVEPDPYYERAVTRAPARSELYDEGDVQMMPPPPRRYIEASEAEALEIRPYRQREPSHRPIEVDYRPQEQLIERRSVMQYEEMGPPLPSEYAPVRHESVQPNYVRVAATPRFREVSVVQQDPFDDRRYAYAAPAPQPGRRYVDDGALDRPVEVAQEPYAGEPRRVSYRY